MLTITRTKSSNDKEHIRPTNQQSSTTQTTIKIQKNPTPRLSDGAKTQCRNNKGGTGPHPSTHTKNSSLPAEEGYFGKREGNQDTHEIHKAKSYHNHTTIIDTNHTTIKHMSSQQTTNNTNINISHCRKTEVHYHIFSLAVHSHFYKLPRNTYPTR